MKIDQIAAEAWTKIMRYYGIQIADGTGIDYIKSAIEKALKGKHCPACNGDELAKISGEWKECPGL